MFGLSYLTRRRAWALVCLRCVLGVVGLVSVLCLVILEPFQVPTGSMAPALCGDHHVCICPRCGQENAVGRPHDHADANEFLRAPRDAFCQNCGLYPIPLNHAVELPGDKVLVNKSAYLLRTPERFEVVVFRLFGVYFIKRLLGLPGESVLIQDGDLYVDGKLCRKTLAQARSMRVLLYDQARGGPERWEPTPVARERTITFDGRLTSCVATYKHFSCSSKCEPISDEYAYNGGGQEQREAVHDFLVDAEMEITAGQGSLGLRLCDGRDWVEIVLPVTEERPAEVFTWPLRRADKIRKLADIEQVAPLAVGRRHRVELAFVDRRISLAVDGEAWLQFDLPEVKRREGVPQPFQLHADGIEVKLHGFQLYRDVHYTQQGKNGVKGKAVRLDAEQYFVLGDNSANSADSRCWPDQGRVPARNLVGSVLLMQRTGVEGTRLGFVR